MTCSDCGGGYNSLLDNANHLCPACYWVAFSDLISPEYPTLLQWLLHEKDEVRRLGGERESIWGDET
jgi:hypothetical protein